jgi:hypothetical protein
MPSSSRSGRHCCRRLPAIAAGSAAALSLRAKTSTRASRTSFRSSAVWSATAASVVTQRCSLTASHVGAATRRGRRAQRPVELGARCACDLSAVVVAARMRPARRWFAVDRAPPSARSRPLLRRRIPRCARGGGAGLIRACGAVARRCARDLAPDGDDLEDGGVIDGAGKVAVVDGGFEPACDLGVQIVGHAAEALVDAIVVRLAARAVGLDESDAASTNGRSRWTWALMARRRLPVAGMAWSAVPWKVGGMASRRPAPQLVAVSTASS